MAFLDKPSAARNYISNQMARANTTRSTRCVIVFHVTLQLGDVPQKCHTLAWENIAVMNSRLADLHMGTT